MNQTLELPEPLYRALLEESERTGTTPADWIAERLPRPRRTPTPEEVAEDNARLRECIIDIGNPGPSDNESIDADLARAYADNHEPSDG